MTKKATITVILDRSGSMGSVQQETVKGFNRFAKEQPKDSSISLWQFDMPEDKPDISQTFKDVPASEVKLRSSQYAPRGLTPLLDAVGEVVSRIKGKGEQIVLIITDGAENASREWTLKRVRDLIEAKRKKGWQFVFMGAGIDAYGEASSYGISAVNTYAYDSTPTSTNAAWSNVSSGTHAYLRGVTNTIVMPDNDTADPTYIPPKS